MKTIIEMAKECGVHEYGPLTRNWSFELSQLERFAALVADAERERCKAVLMAAHELSKQHHNYYHYIALQLDETVKVMK